MRKARKGKTPAEAKAHDATSEVEEDAKEDLELTDDEAGDVAGGDTMTKAFYSWIKPSG